MERSAFIVYQWINIIKWIGGVVGEGGEAGGWGGVGTGTGL